MNLTWFPLRLRVLAACLLWHRACQNRCPEGIYGLKELLPQVQAEKKARQREKEKERKKAAAERKAKTEAEARVAAQAEVVQAAAEAASLSNM